MSNVCKVADILSEVRTLMDMNSTDNALIGLGDEETLEVNDIIRQNIETAVRDVMMIAPTRLLGGGIEIPGSNLKWEQLGTRHVGHIGLPSDFMRLVKFKMSGWSHAVSIPITDEDDDYVICRSRYALRGIPSSPVVALTTGDNAEQTLEFYSCDTQNDQIEVARYLQKPQIKGDSGKGYLSFKGTTQKPDIIESSITGDYDAVYHTGRKMFVYKNKGPLAKDYYASCGDNEKYNDVISGTVRQDATFYDGTDIYRYDSITGGLKKDGVLKEEIIDIPELLHEDVVYRIAYLSFLVLGDDNAATRMSNALKSE